MTDTEARLILGLPSPFLQSDLRLAYRRKAKEIHPDLAGETFTTHFQMIELNQAYNFLQRQVGPPASKPQKSPSPKDDYELYRCGVGIFERIHPSEWVTVTEQGLFDPSAVGRKEKITEAFPLALRRIGEAYQLFSEVVNRFPGSIWAQDSFDKLATLDKMIVRYKKMAQNTNPREPGTW